MKSLFVSLALTALAVSSFGDPSEFPGWQGLRVIKVENGAYKMLPLRDGVGSGVSLMVVETRQSRIDFYRYVGTQDESDLRAALDNPNFLPMAEDFEKVEERRTSLPQIAAVHDVEGDGLDEIFLVQGDPRKLVALKKKGTVWVQIKEWEISPSELTSAEPILVRPVGDGLQILLSFADGIQVIDYAKPGEVEWLQPREREIARNRWWLTDLDGDGDQDLVEAQNSTNAPVRWYEAEGWLFRPAVNISDDITNSNVVRLLDSSDGPRLALLGAGQSNTISVFQLGRGDESPYGQRNLLPLMQPDAGGWASILLDSKRSIIELDRKKPLLKVFQEERGFWRYRDAFPILQNVKALRPVRDAANTVLFRVDGEGQLFSSSWDGERFTFPKRLGDSAANTVEWSLLAFDQYGADTWWVTQQGSALVLSVWNSKAQGPVETTFPGIKGDYESCVWLGGETLLVKKKFSKSADVCQLVDGAAVMVASRFKGNDIRKIRYNSGQLYLAENGVVQKLDGKLEVVDQIMLDGDYSIRSFAVVDGTQAYALEEDGKHLNVMKENEAGIFRSVGRSIVPFSLEVVYDDVLGLTLVGANAINVPSSGSSPQLVLEALIDPNEGASRDFEKKTLGTLFALDIDGDGSDEIATVDYGQRNIIVYGEGADGYEEVISWRFFDDGKYPYGQDTNNRAAVNPYRMLAFDIDGDSFQDLVLASHDRILVYLSKEEGSN